MKRIILPLVALFFALSCTKERVENPQNCASVWLVSKKYTVDTVLLRTDTLWHDNICGNWLDSCKKQGEQWVLFCTPPDQKMPDFILEKLTYIYKQ